MSKAGWNYLNGMPKAFRRGTNDTLLAIFPKLEQVRKDNPVSHTPEEVETLADQFDFINHDRDGHYSTIDRSTAIMTGRHAFSLIKRILTQADTEYVLTFITKWDPGSKDWKMIRNL